MVTRRAFVFAPFGLLATAFVAHAQLDEVTPSATFVGEQFTQWSYSATIVRNNVVVTVVPAVGSMETALAYDRANRQAVGQIQESGMITVTFRSPITADEVQELIRMVGITVDGYIAVAIGEQNELLTYIERGVPGVQPLQGPVATATRPGATAVATAVPSPRAGFRGYVMIDIRADASQLATLFADSRIFTIDAVRIFATQRARILLSKIDATATTLPATSEVFFAYRNWYSRLIDAGVVSVP